MKRFLLGASVLIGCLSLLIASDPAETRPGFALRITFTGLPDKTSDGVLIVCLIRLADGTVTNIVREDPASEIKAEAPAGPLALDATFFSASSDLFLEGSAITSGEDSVEIEMESPAATSSSARSGLPTYPPDEGMAIGYNPADFSVTGSEAEPGMELGFAGMVVTGLTQAPCASGEDRAYMVVETANPRGMALIEAELKLQGNPEFDPDERVTPHLIAATHLVKGTFSVGKDTFAVELYVEDLEGDVIARTRASSPIDELFETVEKAARSLAEQLCRKKGAEQTSQDNRKGPAG